MNSGKILVTGGCGFLGSALVSELSNKGVEVVAVDNGLTSRPGVSGGKVVHLAQDIRDVAEWKQLLRDVRGVAHLAAVVGDPACDIDHDLAWETNYLGTVRLAEACREYGVDRFVLASTCSNYGVSASIAANTRTLLNPQSVYALTKVQAEHHLLATADESFRPLILRLATLYGVAGRMRFDLSVNMMTARAVLGGRVVVHGGEQWRPFIHVRDAAAVIAWALLDAPAGSLPSVVNCGTENQKMIDVGGLIAEQAKAKLAVSSRNGDCRNYQVDFTGMANGFSGVPRLRLVDGVREIIENVHGGGFGDVTSIEYSNRELVDAAIERGHRGAVVRGDHNWPPLVFTAN
jgi:nucleoside-diphosphate-sugar epimerase